MQKLKVSAQFTELNTIVIEVTDEQFAEIREGDFRVLADAFDGCRDIESETIDGPDEIEWELWPEK